MTTLQVVENKKRLRIDMQLLPIKIHYFLAFGALGGVMPFLPVMAKSLNIHATAAGIMFTVIPFCVLLVKPLIGSISDHFQNMQKVIIILFSCVSIVYMLLLLVPPIPVKQQEVFATLKCQDSTANTTLPTRYDPDCLSVKLQSGVVCDVSDVCESETIFRESCNDIRFHITLLLNASSNVDLHGCRKPNGTISESSDLFPTTQEVSSSSVCSCLEENPVSFNCTPSFESCSLQPAKDDSSEVYRSFQFWVFLILVMVGNSGSGAMFSLSDTACYQVLGERAELYGRQRLFGTVSWGAIAFLTGYFNDLASAVFGTTNYSPGFYLMAVMAALDLLILWRVINLKQSTYSQKIWKDIGSLFSSCHVVAFALGVLIAGGLSGLLWNYQFWYLQNLGASQSLLGLTVTVQCLAAEVPFFFFSGWIIDRLGHSLCLIITFAAFALRYFLYYLLQDPWYVLPIEVLHGWTFGVFYATMTSYARHHAPPGTEATMQGVLGGLFEGLGLAIGSLLSGVGFDQLGGRHTFLTAAIVSALSSIALSVVTIVLRKQQ